MILFSLLNYLSVQEQVKWIQVSLSWEVQILRSWFLPKWVLFPDRMCWGSCRRPEEFSLLHHTSFTHWGMYLQMPLLWKAEFQTSFCLLLLDSGVHHLSWRCGDLMVNPSAGCTDIFGRSYWWRSKCWHKSSISTYNPISLFILPDILFFRKTDVFWRLSHPDGINPQK